MCIQPDLENVNQLDITRKFTVFVRTHFKCLVEFLKKINETLVKYTMFNKNVNQVTR